MQSSSVEKYHIALRLTHWFMAICILGLIGLGWYMVEFVPDDEQKLFYMWHKAFGTLMIMLFFLRLLLRNLTQVPPLPEGIKSFDRKLSHIVHRGLYVLMIFVPLVGFVMSNTAGYPVWFFGWDVPNPFGENPSVAEVAEELHKIGAYVLLGVLVLHIAGAFKHRLLEGRENDVLRRMWPW